LVFRQSALEVVGATCSDVGQRPGAPSLMAASCMGSGLLVA
jgi:hypothetical protein